MPITPLSEHLSPVPLRLSYLAPATVSSNRAKAKAFAIALALALAPAFLTLRSQSKGFLCLAVNLV